MSRLPYIERADLDERGQKLWDSLATTRAVDVTQTEGHLVGPFNAFVHTPRVGRWMSGLGGSLRSDMSFERRLIELAIITVGAHWKAEFEWWAHAAMARDAGVTDEVIDAIAEGAAPSFARDDERAVYAVARQLLERGRLDDDAYAAAHAVLGDRGMVELVALCGYYCLISFLLNAFEVPLPPGEQNRW